jgi:preprotein translocase subunit SecG
MQSYSNNINRKTSISTLEKFVTILMLVFIFLALLLVVNQAANNRKLQLEKRSVELKLVEIKEQQNIVKSRLAESSLPVLNLEAATANNISLVKIPFEQINVVLVGE